MTRETNTAAKCGPASRHPVMDQLTGTRPDAQVACGADPGCCTDAMPCGSAPLAEASSSDRERRALASFGERIGLDADEIVEILDLYDRSGSQAGLARFLKLLGSYSSYLTWRRCRADS